MDKIYIGKIVNTHGIKGELRIRSDFLYKDKVFVKGNSLIIDDKKYLIKTYRHHKTFDMVMLDEYNNINQVLFLVGKKVYFDKSLLILDDNEVLDSDLVNYNIVDTNGIELEIEEVFYASSTNKIIRTNKCLIPFNSPMIKKIDKAKKEIIVDVGDLL
jgi:16S rRNA processing protein rimM